MALSYADRVRETTTTTGTGTYSLAGATGGYQTFVAGAGDSSTVTYCCTDGTDWEVGEGVVTDATPDTLTRATILESSNADAAVNWGAGEKIIFLTHAARDVDTPGTPIIDTTTTRTLTASDNRKVIGFTNASAITVTLPQNTTEALLTGFHCVLVRRSGAGVVTVATEGTDALETAIPSAEIAEDTTANIIKWVSGSPNTWGMY